MSKPNLLISRSRKARSHSAGWLLGAAILFASGAHAQFNALEIVGDTPLNGIFDPSVEFAPGAAEGWLAYSAVFGGLNPFGPHVETHLARSGDAGATWTFDSIAAVSNVSQLQNFDGSLIDGVWNAEVPSLVYDPSDPGAEWKLFFHRIFRKSEDNFTEEQNLPAYSWIGFRSAPDPSGPWSVERSLLSSGIFPPAPYDDVEVAINPLDPSLSSLIVYSEPGAFVLNGTIYLSLTGLLATGPDRIILLASDDHAASWRYVSTLLAPADIAALGFLSADGSAIVEDAGRVFLLATPETTTSLHDGTLVIEFDSLSQGTLRRSAGVPEVHLHVPAQPGLPLDRRGGQADFHEGNRAGGLLQPAIQFSEFPSFFTISQTGVDLAAPPVPSPAGFAGGATLLAVLVTSAGLRALRRRDPSPTRLTGE